MSTPPPVIRPTETPAMVTLGLLTKLVRLADRVHIEQGRVSNELATLAADDKVRAIVADMKRVCIL